MEERAELARRKKEREEQHLYLQVDLISDESFKCHHGFDLTYSDMDPDDPAAPKMLRVLRTMKIGQFIQQIADDKGLLPEQIRLWAMVNRQNKTVRPDQPIRDLNMSLQEAATRYGSKGTDFRIWYETKEVGPEGKVSWQETQPGNGYILVFLKHFDVAAQDLVGVGHVFVKKTSKVEELAPTILDLMSWPPGTRLLLFEVRNSRLGPGYANYCVDPDV
jgi:ubiquitin carboxyl-terminal hydrolase 7